MVALRGSSGRSSAKYEVKDGKAPEINGSKPDFIAEGVKPSTGTVSGSVGSGLETAEHRGLERQDTQWDEPGSASGQFDQLADEIEDISTQIKQHIPDEVMDIGGDVAGTVFKTATSYKQYRAQSKKIKVLDLKKRTVDKWEDPPAKIKREQAVSDLRAVATNMSVPRTVSDEMRPIVTLLSHHDKKMTMDSMEAVLGDISKTFNLEPPLAFSSSATTEKQKVKEFKHILKKYGMKASTKKGKDADGNKVKFLKLKVQSVKFEKSLKREDVKVGGDNFKTAVGETMASYRQGVNALNGTRDEMVAQRKHLAKDAVVRIIGNIGGYTKVPGVSAAVYSIADTRNIMEASDDLGRVTDNYAGAMTIVEDAAEKIYSDASSTQIEKEEIADLEDAISDFEATERAEYENIRQDAAESIAVNAVGAAASILPIGETLARTAAKGVALTSSTLRRSSDMKKLKGEDSYLAKKDYFKRVADIYSKSESQTVRSAVISASSEAVGMEADDVFWIMHHIDDPLVDSLLDSLSMGSRTTSGTLKPMEGHLTLDQGLSAFSSDTHV